MIRPGTPEQLALVLAAKFVGTLEELPESKPGSASINALGVDGVQDVLDEQGLHFDAELVASAVAALQADKHLLLMGPPGTGKTSLAEALAEAAHRAGVANGYIPTTGSSDWTPADTVGAYRLTKSNSLEFIPGQVLQAIDDASWLVLDELNRADIDRAIGPLFTVLSGKATVLRYEVERNGLVGKVAVLPAGTATPAGTVPFVVGDGWRLIATMNSQDRDVLFEVSQAFMRRLAVIDVNPPSEEVHREMLAEYATGWEELDSRVLALVSLEHLPLGAAITLDCARFVKRRYDDSVARGVDVAFNALMTEAVRLFVQPQLAALGASARATAMDYLRSNVTNGLAVSVAPTVEDDEDESGQEETEDLEPEA